MAALALMRLAASDNDQAAGLLEDRWTPVLGAGTLAAWAWSQVGQAGRAGKLLPEALGYTRTAWTRCRTKGSDHRDWSDETLAWLARAALRQGEGPSAGSWPGVPSRR
jgi:soluble lytic murein transglycosylase